jgi:DNA topoisomerase-1
MPKNLVIVESPAKAKTIEGYLGSDFLVMSSYGHVRDLQKGNNAIDVENDFTPTYIVSDDKKQVVAELKKLAKAAEVIWLATDDDREGEAISWHLKEALELNDSKIKRIVFREITKTAVTSAIQSPRTIDNDLVNAQQARRILDRLVGFELSPVLWKKIKGGLSAGRVQSVAVRIVVEREREIGVFDAVGSFKVVAIFELDGGKSLKAELPKKFETEAEAKQFLIDCNGADFKISDLQTKPAKKSPAAPFTTSTLQQEASRKLSYPVGLTMSVAQKLYEGGHITYMRTDSVNLSELALGMAKDAITKEFGVEYAFERKFKTKSNIAQEAHEAIRPTNFEASNIPGIPDNQRKLYDLIWKRAIASQMADAKLEKTTAKISISTLQDLLVAKGEMIMFEGFLKVYLESSDEEDDDEDQKGMLPPLTVGQDLDLSRMNATERFTRSSPRYTEASLVKKLEEMGIGRPSTYAPTVSTIQKRQYVIKESREGREREYVELILENNQIDKHDRVEITGAENNKLFPTNTGMVVNDFLVKHFPNIVDFSFTAKVEEEFDIIAKGKLSWPKMLKNFYGGFHETVEAAESIDRAEAGSVRVLGTDPKSGKPLSVKLGKYGPYAQIGTQEDEEKPTYASLRKGQLLENITMEEAIELFKLPRQIGEFEEKVVTAAIGRFGPYLRHDSKFTSLPKEYDPLEVDLETAIQLILDKREADAKKIIQIFEKTDDYEEIRVLNGRWGPYISFQKKNFKIPKDKEAEGLTLAECIDLIENPIAKGRGKKAPAKKATTAKKTTATKKTTAKKAPAKKAPAKKKPAAKKK